MLPWPQPEGTQGLGDADRGTKVHHAGSRGCGPQDPPLRASERGQREVGSVCPGPAGRPGRMWTSTLPPLQSTAASVAGAPQSFRGSVPASWSRHGPVGRDGRPFCPVKSLWLGAGSYRAKQLVHLHGLYLRAAGGLKIEESRLGRESIHCSVSWAMPGSGPCPSLLQLGGWAGAWLPVAAPPCPQPGPAGLPSAPLQSSPAGAGVGSRSSTWGPRGKVACAGETGALTRRPAPLGLCDPNILTSREGWPTSVSTGPSRAFVLSYSGPCSGRCPVRQDGN